jgi:hypothetical protein
MSNEALRGAMREHSGTLLLRQFAKHRPYYAATVVTQNVQPICEQCPNGVGIDGRAVANNVRRRRKAANASETQRTKQADHQPTDVDLPGSVQQIFAGTLA